MRDAASERIEGFPWLRVNRPLASFREETDTEPRFAAWLARLSRLDAVAREHELANLPPVSRQRLSAHWAPAAESSGLPPELTDALDHCRPILNERLRADGQARARLREAATVPDAYAGWMRVAGLYPLARLLARPRVRALHQRLEALLQAGPDDELLREYAAPLPNRFDGAGQAMVHALPRDALGIPAPTKGQRRRLLAAHAPAWAVETTSGADRPGTVRLEDGARPWVDMSQPVEYRHFSWTRFHGEVLPQLNYTLWFPRRAPKGAFDIYAGPLDAVTLRVTLAPDGDVLAYDSIHACGCYYTLLPGPGWRAVDHLPPTEEPVFAPQPAPRPGPGERVRVALEHGRHYFLGARTVDARGEGRVTLTPMPEDRLRSLPMPDGGNASLYDEDGLIPESVRPERLLLWPLGVPSAGAMRQRGHHAIAFIGRRHFDDPYLLEGLLRPTGR
ncbi:hypothetical protein [Arhodomonas sp. SL1]|uniref:hypothetical protein n=1 Tax=Arhodomonas sp. SL1 TaxID=3425691 RepID=UPI003F8836F8